MLTESRIYEGRISREELEYYTSIPHINSLSIQEFQSKSESESRIIIRDIIQYIQYVIHKSSRVFKKWNDVLQAPHFQIPSGHGQVGHLYLKEAGVLKDCPSGYSDSDRKSQQEDYCKLFYKEYHTITAKFQIIIDNFSDTTKTGNPHDFLEFKEQLLDFILYTIPGRTFINTK